MSREHIQRWPLAVIALFMLPTAIQVTSVPESWFEDFPLGRGWMAAEAVRSSWAGLRPAMANEGG